MTREPRDHAVLARFAWSGTGFWRSVWETSIFRTILDQPPGTEVKARVQVILTSV
jgi:hypothetical protein